MKLQSTLYISYICNVIDHRRKKGRTTKFILSRPNGRGVREDSSESDLLILEILKLPRSKVAQVNAYRVTQHLVPKLPLTLM